MSYDYGNSHTKNNHCSVTGCIKEPNLAKSLQCTTALFVTSKLTKCHLLQLGIRLVNVHLFSGLSAHTSLPYFVARDIQKHCQAAPPHKVCVTNPNTSICPCHLIDTVKPQVKSEVPKCGGFLQFKGLSGGLPRWRAAYDEALNRTLSQSEKQNRKFREWVSWLPANDASILIRAQTTQTFMSCITHETCIVYIIVSIEEEES